MLTFLYPALLWTSPLPLLMGWLNHKWRHPDGAAIYHPHGALIAELQGEMPLRRSVNWGIWISISLLLLATAGPRWNDQDDPALTMGRNIMLAIDVSGSMRALTDDGTGQGISRLDRVKAAVRTLLKANPRDRFGIIVFADHAMTYLPISRDHALVAEQLNELGNDIAGERTAIGDAVALASAQLSRFDARSRILILLSDGSNTAGEIAPLKALQTARRDGVRIFSVAVGSDGLVPYPQGPAKPAIAARLPVDRELMTQLAERTGGVFQQASTPSDLENIINNINGLTTTPTKENETFAARELYVIPLLLAVAVYVWSGIFGRRNRILP